MLRILIAATLLLLVSATSAVAGSSDGRAEGLSVQLRIGARLSSSQVLVPPSVHASIHSGATHRTINGVALAVPAAGRPGMLGFLDLGGEERGLAVPVSDSVSLGLGYEYLRREDIRLEVAETGSLHEGYSTHNVVVRARWKF